MQRCAMYNIIFWGVIKWIFKKYLSRPYSIWPKIQWSTGIIGIFLSLLLLLLFFYWNLLITFYQNTFLKFFILKYFIFFPFFRNKTPKILLGADHNIIIIVVVIHICIIINCIFKVNTVFSVYSLKRLNMYFRGLLNSLLALTLNRNTVIFLIF